VQGWGCQKVLAQLSLAHCSACFSNTRVTSSAMMTPSSAMNLCRQRVSGQKTIGLMIGFRGFAEAIVCCDANHIVQAVYARKHGSHERPATSAAWQPHGWLVPERLPAPLHFPTAPT
jgi:hypothetical protein